MHDTLFSQEAEVELIWRLLLEPDLIWTVRPHLPPNAFYLVRYRELYEAMCAVSDAGKTIDTLSVIEQLQQQGASEYEAIRSMLSTFDDHIFPPSDPMAALEIVLDYHRRRQALKAAGELARGAYAGGDKFEKSVSTAVTSLTASAAGPEEPGLDETVAELSTVIAARLENPLGPGEVPGIPTGLLDLDSMLGGLEPALYTIAGRAHMGKTALALAIALNVARQGRPVLFISLEMSALQLAERSICMMAKVDRYDLRTGRLVSDSEAQSRVAHATNQLARLPLTIRTDCRRPDAAAAAVHREVARRGCEVVILDYLGLMAWQGLGDNKHQGLGEAARRMKDIVGQLQVPFLLLHQVGSVVDSRADKRPLLSDLYETGLLEQHADFVLFVYRESYYVPNATNQHITEIICRKDRFGGRLGHCQVYLGPFGEVADLASKERYPERNGIPF